MLRMTFLVGLFALVACSELRTTGPKTSYDYCVDDCDNAVSGCGHPMVPASCDIEYDACIQGCIANESRSTH
jgi:hypothetical protein